MKYVKIVNYKNAIDMAIAFYGCVFIVDKLSQDVHST
jgi:hypothetical protein